MFSVGREGVHWEEIQYFKTYFMRIFAAVKASIVYLYIRKGHSLIKCADYLFHLVSVTVSTFRKEAQN